MSLYKEFQFINEFFEQDKFDQKSLDDLYFIVDEKLKNDKDLLGKAKQLINLHLLKFALHKVEEVHYENVHSNQTKTIKSHSSKKRKKNKTISLTHKREESIELDLDRYSNMSLDELAFKLNVKLSTLERYLVSVGIKLKPKSKLTVAQINSIEEFILNRIKTINRKSLSQKKISEPYRKDTVRNRSRGRNETVYDEISKRGGIGKVIYIRSK